MPPSHIPDAHEKTTLFYGWYSNRTRGYRKRHGLLAKAGAADPVPGTDDRALLEVRRSWARRFRKVYEVDPLLCPRCGGTMKVVAVIEPACADTADRRPAVACRPAGRSGRSSIISGSPPQRPASERRLIRPMAYRLTRPASGPMNRSLPPSPAPSP